jgi:hypothetical protein
MGTRSPNDVVWTPLRQSAFHGQADAKIFILPLDFPTANRSGQVEKYLIKGDIKENAFI